MPPWWILCGNLILPMAIDYVYFYSIEFAKRIIRYPDRRVIVWAYPLAHEVWEAIDINCRTGLSGIAEEQLLTVTLGKPIHRGAKATGESSLQRG